jgi:hypothetical protein
VEQTTCPACGHTGFNRYFTVTKWFRLYFVPLIPYETKHFLVCPVCTRAEELSSAGVADVKRRMQPAVAPATTPIGSGLPAAQAAFDDDIPPAPLPPGRPDPIE